MMKDIDELARRHARLVAPRSDSLRANKAIHVAGMTGFAGLGGAFLKFSGDPAVGVPFAIVAFVGFVFLVLTGLLCLIDHRVY
jgi:hypothetical protein